MLSRFQHWVCSGVLLAFLAGSQTGCQSWKTPSFNMFPWSKKPSPDKIVGTKPPSTLPSSPSTSGSTMLAQDTSKSGGPISPASRNTPSSIPGTPTGASSSSVAMPSPGAAAANNGFTPGTYNVPQNRGPAGAPNPYAANPYAANPYAAAPNSIPQPATMPPGANPYAMAQAPGNINPYGSSLPTTTGNPVSPASMAVPPMSAPPMNASFNATPSQPGPNFQNNIPNLPVAYGGPGLPPQGVPSLTPPSTGTPVPYGPATTLPPSSVPSLALPPSPSSQIPIPQFPGGQPSIPQGVGPQGSGSFGGMPTGAIPSAGMPAGSGAAYRPGSVNRNTGYDFSGQSQVR
jgi:hypothetical protein